VPPPLRSILFHWTPLLVVDVTNQGQWQRHEGIQGVVVRGVEEEEDSAIVLVHQVLIQPGVEDGGKRSGMALVGLRGS
jgi:hypothetical protein